MSAGINIEKRKEEINSRSNIIGQIFKHFGTQAHLFEKICMGVVGISSCSFMTPLVVEFFFCTMNLKKTFIRAWLISFLVLENS